MEPFCFSLLIWLYFHRKLVVSTVNSTAHDAKYACGAIGTAKPGAKTGCLTSTFYTHVQLANASINSILQRGDSKLVAARRTWILRHLVGQHCPEYWNDSSSGGAAVHTGGASVAAVKDAKLTHALLGGVKKALEMLEPKNDNEGGGRGRYSNARSTLRRFAFVTIFESTCLTARTWTATQTHRMNNLHLTCFCCRHYTHHIEPFLRQSAANLS